MRIGTSALVLFHRFFPLLVRAQKAQVSSIKCQNHPHLLKLAQLLSQKNYILAYRVDQDFLHLALRQSTQIGVQPPFRRVDLLSSPGRPVSVTRRQLHTLTNQDPYSLYILSTPKGLLPADQALVHQTGGLLIARLGY